MKKISILFVCLLGVFTLAAQGTITGTMIDGDSGEPLMFANVSIEGTTTGTDTDFDGKFILEVEPGTYTVVASYVGYPTKKMESVVVKDKEVTYLDFTMTEDAQILEEVVVKAEKIERTEVALLVQQRKADKIQDAISSEEMSRFSVGDAAGAMKKVTGATVQGGKYIFIRGLGDRYSLSQLNGLIMPSSDPYRNGAQLDLIPANLLENIVTAKTFTPDQPGTFTGGAVNLKTKSIPEQYSLTISTSASYNSQSNLIDDFLTVDEGSSDKWGFGSNNRPLPQFIIDANANPDNEFYFDNNTPFVAERVNERFDGQEIGRLQDRAVSELSNKFQPTRTSTPVNHNLGFAFGNRYSIGDNPFGVILAGSFKREFTHLPDLTRQNWRLLNAANGLQNRGDLDVTQSTESPTLNGLAGLAYKFGRGQEINFTTIYNRTADKISREAAGERPDNIIAPDFYRGTSLTYNERELIAYQLGGEHVLTENNIKLDWKVGRTNSFMREPDTRYFEYQYNSDFGDVTIPASNIQRPFHFFRNLEDVQMDYKLDITIPIKDTDNKLKFGTYITQKDREFQEYRFQVEENTGETQRLMIDEERAANGEIGFADLDAYLAPENMGVIGQSDRGGVILANYITDVSQLRNIYSGSADVAAAYGMATINIFEPLKFVGGVRFEKTDYLVESADTSAQNGVIDVADFLPSASLIYKISERMNLRAVYSRTVARPNMREITPFASFDPLLLLTYFGNPDLQRTNISNYDLRWELYPASGELIAFSAYYKDFKNPIAAGFRDKLGREIQYGNPESAELYGAEFEVRKSLGFVPGLQDFKVSGNFSYIISRMDALDFTDVAFERERPFIGQPEYIINTSLIYDNKALGLDGVVSLNVLGDQLLYVGLEETPDTYERGRAQLDIALRKKIGNATVKATVNNLLNSPYLQSLEQGGDEDFIFSRFQTGINFGLGFSYTLK